jgi:hypothetical protein
MTKPQEQAASDPAYLARRAEEERAAAESAADERARDTHLELARRYAAAAAGEGPPPSPEGNGQLLAPEFRIIG